MNQAYVFIKPHAVDNLKVVEFVKDVFDKNGISIISSGEVLGPQIDKDGLIDKHYSVNAHVGSIGNVSDLEVNEHTKEVFNDLFGESWDQVIADDRIFSGVETQKRLNIATGVDLRTKWDGYGTQKIAGGMYVSFFQDENIYVLNGFYPSIREVFTNPEARLLTFIVEFDAVQLPWQKFRGGIIGVTDPANADPESIRGYMHRHGAEDFGMEVSCGSNVIHASASPFEAFIEKGIWVDGFDLGLDPLSKALDAKGIGSERIVELFEANPFVEYGGEEDHLIDVLEDKDTELVADILATL